MSLNINRYVRITSGVGGASGVPARELIGRLFTSSVRVAVDEVLEFSSATAVGTYFGTTSPEYARALFYFGFVSKSLGSPRSLSFARFAPTAEPARAFGTTAGALSSLQAITAGALTLVSAGVTADVTGLNFSTATTYADVATALQTAIRGEGGAPFVTATVAYNAVSGGFDIATSVPGPGGLTISGSSAAPLGLDDAFISPGVAAQTVGAALGAAADISTNAGSFAFVASLTEAQALEAAQWNAAQNVEYIACIRITDANSGTLPPALENLSGVAMTYAPVSTEFDEMLPMAVLAATNFERQGSAQNYMFQQAALTAKVTSEAQADAFDAARVNYYGQTQTAGQRLAFYQRGVLGGVITDPLDQNTYANEIWLKDAARAALMGLLLSAPRVPANVEGRAQVLAVLQGPIDRALVNGTISTGKTLSEAQKAHITTVTGDPEAWRQVQSGGYWVDAVVVQVPGTPPEYRVDYVLVYSKDDAIRQIVGTHDLI